MTKGKFEEAVQAIDGLGSMFRRGIITNVEVVDQLVHSVESMLFSDAPDDDKQLFYDYALIVAEQISTELWDRAMEVSMRERLQFAAIAPMLHDDANNLLAGIELGLEHRDKECEELLRDLCQRGRHSHRALLSLGGVARRLLKLAARFRRVDALAAAVHPNYFQGGRLGHHNDTRDDFNFAMDQLAYIAADPENGAEARTVLLELTDRFETAGEAAIRLPLHLLTYDERTKLIETFEARVATCTDDPVVVPMGLEMTRDTEVLRSAVWQAMDAPRLR